MSNELSGSNPFRRGPGGRPLARPPTPEERDKQRREKQLKLGVLWSERRITKERLQERRVGFTQADIDRYRIVTKDMQAMKGSEEPGWCEWLMMEGADGEGGTTNSRYEWFGKNAIAYNPNKIDDVLHRTDALVMIYDRGTQKKAYPIAIDVASTHEATYADGKTKGFGDKIRKDFERLNPKDVELSSAYWIDTESDEPGEAIIEPREGRIQTLPVSVYIPASFAERYRDEKTTVREADHLMQRLRPFILEQMRIEMEAQAMYLLGDLRFEKISEGRGKTTIRTREQLMSRLDASPFQGMKKRAVEILQHTLPVIWESIQASSEIDPSLASEMPKVLQQMNFLSRPEEFVGAAE